MTSARLVCTHRVRGGRASQCADGPVFAYLGVLDVLVSSEKQDSQGRWWLRPGGRCVKPQGFGSVLNGMACRERALARRGTNAVSIWIPCDVRISVRAP